MKGKITLKGLVFYAQHGYYQEERKLGNHFTVHIFMKLNMNNAVKNDEITGTVNYEKIYNLVAQVMTKQYQLLEHIAGKIIEEIKANFELKWIKVKIIKHNPPIKGLCKYVSVSLKKHCK